jgi:hypothetical protein
MGEREGSKKHDPGGPPASSAYPPGENSSTGPGQAGKEGDADGYPLRAPDEDPRWAVNTVRIWLGIAVFSLVAIMALLFLGVFFD